MRKFDDSLHICPPYLYTVATLPWEIQKKNKRWTFFWDTVYFDGVLLKLTHFSHVTTTSYHELVEIVELVAVAAEVILRVVVTWAVPASVVQASLRRCGK